MNDSNVTFRFIVWQRLVTQVQELALKMPEMGLNADALAYQPIDNLTGILAFIKRQYADKCRSD